MKPMIYGAKRIIEVLDEGYIAVLLAAQHFGLMKSRKMQIITIARIAVQKWKEKK